MKYKGFWALGLLCHTVLAAGIYLTYLWADQPEIIIGIALTGPGAAMTVVFWEAVIKGSRK